MSAGRPRLVQLAALLLGVLGVASLALGLSSSAWLLVVGIGLIVLAPAMWIGLKVARLPAIAAGLLALLPGAYGIWGLTVVAGDFAHCAQQPTASILATSLPADYCNIVNWVKQFGTGFGLVGVGIVGLIVIAALVWENEYFDRPLSRRQTA
jgi:hypothetical protein